VKIIKVKNCEDCIYYINIGRPYFYFYCGEKYRLTKEIFKIEDENKIPLWCPLPDIDEAIAFEKEMEEID